MGSTLKGMNFLRWLQILSFMREIKYLCNDCSFLRILMLIYSSKSHTFSGRGKRKVNSRYSKRKATPSPKKPLPRTPVKKQFSGLMGIIDSEGSD